MVFFSSALNSLILLLKFQQISKHTPFSPDFLVFQSYSPGHRPNLNEFKTEPSPSLVAVPVSDLGPGLGSDPARSSSGFTQRTVQSDRATGRFNVSCGGRRTTPGDVCTQSFLKYSGFHGFHVHFKLGRRECFCQFQVFY